ncbi:MAG: dUTP diphosphatase [Ruminococcaceae bacterium]|nr:dUTP diphosphatase [Oscillospiraceae bacterium]
MEKFNVNFLKINDDAIIPTYGTLFSAGADLYSVEKVKIDAGETKIIHTGIVLEIPEGYGGFVFARSGMASKRGLAPANKVGVIDSDYRGEIMVSLHNHSKEIQTVEKGERVAQIVFMPYAMANFIQTEDLSKTERGEGGFGSTGTK